MRCLAPRLAPRLALCLALMPTLAVAQTPMTGAEFDAYTKGKTLSYNSGGMAYGTEQYLAGRRVLWAFQGDECREGVWYDAGGQICFVYEDAPDAPQCWSFYLGTRGLSAQFQDDPAGTALVEVEQSPQPMFCPGPDVGV